MTGLMEIRDLRTKWYALCIPLLISSSLFSQIKKGKYINLSDTVIIRNNVTAIIGGNKTTGELKNSDILIFNDIYKLYEVKELKNTYYLGLTRKSCSTTNYLYLIEEFDDNNNIILTRQFDFSPKGFCMNGFEKKYQEGELIEKTYYFNDKKIFSFHFKRRVRS